MQKSPSESRFVAASTTLTGMERGSVAPPALHARSPTASSVVSMIARVEVATTRTLLRSGAGQGNAVLGLRCEGGDAQNDGHIVDIGTENDAQTHHELARRGCDERGDIIGNIGSQRPQQTQEPGREVEEITDRLQPAGKPGRSSYRQQERGDKDEHEQ